MILHKMENSAFLMIEKWRWRGLLRSLNTHWREDAEIRFLTSAYRDWFGSPRWLNRRRREPRRQGRRGKTAVSDGGERQLNCGGGRHWRRRITRNWRRAANEYRRVNVKLFINTILFLPQNRIVRAKLKWIRPNTGGPLMELSYFNVCVPFVVFFFSFFFFFVGIWFLKF